MQTLHFLDPLLLLACLGGIDLDLDLFFTLCDDRPNLKQRGLSLPRPVTGPPCV